MFGNAMLGRFHIRRWWGALLSSLDIGAEL